MDWILVFAFLAAFATMFVGAISGGVGLVLRPLLIFLGFNPAVVVATAKSSGLIGELPGLYVLNNNKKINWASAWFLVIPMVFGSVLASLAVVSVLKGKLDLAIGLLLIFAAIFLLFNKRFGVVKIKAKFSGRKRDIISFFGTILLSFFGTLTGGLGPVFSMFYIYIYGESYITTSGLWRVGSYVGSIASFFIFLVNDIIDWQLFVVVSAGLALGSYFGTKYSLKKGERWVRGIVIFICFAAAIKLLFF